MAISIGGAQKASAAVIAALGEIPSGSAIGPPAEMALRAASGIGPGEMAFAAVIRRFGEMAFAAIIGRPGEVAFMAFMAGPGGQLGVGMGSAVLGSALPRRAAGSFALQYLAFRSMHMLNGHISQLKESVNYSGRLNG